MPRDRTTASRVSMPETKPPVEAADPNKRGRGRPPKDEKDKKTAKPAVDDGTVRRGRGRPKKEPVAKPAPSPEEARLLALPRPWRWLVKSEPQSHVKQGHDVKMSLDDVQRAPNGTVRFDGVRSKQSCERIRDEFK